MATSFNSQGTVSDDLRKRQVKLVKKLAALSGDYGSLVSLEEELRVTAGMHELADAVRRARLELRTGAVNGIVNHFNV